MNELELVDLMAEMECEWLDFKREHHADTLDLLHDILCLVNAWAEGHDRYLVFGVDDAKTIFGVESDPNRRKSADIQAVLRQSNLNRLPTVALRSYVEEGHAIDVLSIKDRPDKPFYATKDKQGVQRRLRAGVVYTRIGDTNVPLDGTASEEQVELMWRERFGIGQSPMQRVSRLIRESNRWQRIAGDEYLYHEDFPEFTISDDRTLVEDFKEDWTQRFPDRLASSFYVQLRCGTTILRQFAFVICDGGRYRLPLPERDGDRFQINVNSIPWQLALLYRQYLPPDDALKMVGVDLVEGPVE